jgi:hypothetical protein
MAEEEDSRMDACTECHETKEEYKPTGEPQCVNPECHCYMEVAREVYSCPEHNTTEDHECYYGCEWDSEPNTTGRSAF